MYSFLFFHGSHREVYSQFLKEMIIQPGIANANLGLSREDVTMEDHVSHPLSFSLRCSDELKEIMKPNCAMSDKSK